RPPRQPELRGIVPREVRAHHLPVLPLVDRAKDPIAGDPQLAWVPARIEDGKCPLEAIAVLGGRDPHAVGLGPDADDALLPAAVVIVDESAHPGAGADGPANDNVGIARLHRDVAALTAARLDPVDRGDGAAVRLTRQADRPVVL